MDDILNTRLGAIAQKFSTPQREVAQTIASLRVENKFLRNGMDTLKKEYDFLWKLIVMTVDQYPRGEMRIHQSHFIRMFDMYRIDRSFDEETDEIVLKLLIVGEDESDDESGRATDSEGKEV